MASQPITVSLLEWVDDSASVALDWCDLGWIDSNQLTVWKQEVLYLLILFGQCEDSDIIQLFLLLFLFLLMLFLLHLLLLLRPLGESRRQLLQEQLL